MSIRTLQRACTRVLVPTALAAFTAFALPAHAAQVQTYILDVVGQSGFPTYRVPTPVLDFFGPSGVGIPFNGLPAGGLPGVDRLTTAPSGTLADAGSALGSGDSIFGPWSASGSSTATAAFGKLGASGTGNRVGIGDANTVVGFEGFGRYTDSMAIDNPSLAGTSGTTVLHFGVDGSLSRTGVSTVGVAVSYQQNTDPVFTLMSAILQPAGASNFVPLTGPGRAGFSISDTAVSGSGVFDTVALPFTFGSPFDFSLGLFAYSMPRDGTATSSFASTVLLTGIDVFDAHGSPVADFSIVSGSGTLYDADGVHIAAVPEPTTSALLGIGLLGLLGTRLVRRRRGRAIA
jgi:hypothetical protein